MIIVNSDSVLRKYFPNTLVTVTGEIPLFDKVTPFLEMAEEWVMQYLTSAATFAEILGLAEGSIARSATVKIIVSHAMMNAIPSLDVVLTPNGFGIVSNSNIAPASRDRVARLIASLESERDRAIRFLLTLLPTFTSWSDTPQGEYFSATLFPNLDICDYLGLVEHQWQKYQELRPAVIEVEQYITDHFIGAEQMDAFRKEQIAPSSTSAVLKAVIRSLRATEVQMLKARLAATARPCSPPTTLIQVVNIIRNNPDLFTKWHNSTIKSLFSPPVYENCKEDKGFWF